jgi:hypothetical protein
MAQRERGAAPGGDASSEQRADPRGDARADARADPRGDASSEQRADPRPDPRGDPRPDPRGDARADPRSDRRGDARPDPHRDARSDPTGGARGDARPDPRREREATFLGTASLCGAAGALCAAAFASRWFSDAMGGRAGAMTWVTFAPVAFVICEAIAALATGLLAALALIHVRAGRRRRAYALAIVMAGVRSACVALMTDAQFRAGWTIALDDVWAKLVVGFAVAQIVLLLALFTQVGGHGPAQASGERRAQATGDRRAR